ncbi:hypothetical protein V2J09_014345 [Rumex salicifolius]
MQLFTSLSCISATIFFFLLFLFSFSSKSPPNPTPDPKLFIRPTNYLPNPNPGLNSSPDPDPPSIAYFISGSSGDLGRIIRLLFAVYHPKNLYLLHLDRLAPQCDRRQLALYVQSVPVFGAARNVHVIGEPDFAYVRGSTPISSVLRGASILLRLSNSWDWFINLSVKDYPLVTQDEWVFPDLLHIFSFLPKELNFVNHTSYIGWRESRKLRRIIVDPGLYQEKKTDMFYASGKRGLPNAYHLFTGSQMAILNRKFVEFCVLSSDNLPRKLMMYLANTPSSLVHYFSTILCNSPEFIKTAINHNLQYASSFNATDMNSMIQSGSAFATGFVTDDDMLDFIDSELLGRSPGKLVPGGWCLGPRNDTCVEWGHADILRPGHGAKRLENRLVELLSNGNFRSQQCVVE